MVSVFPCLSLPRPPRHHERGAKLKYSLNTFIRHNKLHQLLSSHTQLCSTNNYIIFPFGPGSEWSEWSETLSMQKLILHLWTTGVTVCLLVIDNPVWHCPTDSKLPTYSELRSKSYIGIIIENWSALRGTLYKKIGSIEFLIEMLMVDTQNTIQHSNAPRGALIC